MKILILTTNTGSGHNTAAKAILTQAEKMGHSAVMIDFLMFSSPRTSNAVSKIYSATAVHTPKVIKAGAYIADKITQMETNNKNMPIPPVYKYMKKPAQRLYKFIRDNGFDCVISAHIFAAQMMTYITKTYDTDVKTGFVMTDYTMQQFMPETDSDVYFTPHKFLSESLKEYMPDKNFVSTGIPVSEKFAAKTDKQNARKILGLDKYEKSIMVMTGSMGFGKIEEIIKQLNEMLDDNTQIVVLCANNEKIKKTLRDEYGSASKIKAIGFTDRVDLYMDACDVLITKPGGLSVTEAAVKEIPLILSSPIPGWEEKNVEFFSLLGMSEGLKEPKEIARCAAQLIENKPKAEEMIAKQRRHINKNAAYEIITAMENIKKSD